MVALCVPSVTESSTAVTVMVWATFHCPGRKVRVGDDNVTWLSGVMVTITLALGWLVSTTV